MITVLLNWGYIFIITYLIGLGFFKLLSILLKRPFTITFFSSILCGIAVTTVYAQMLSLFCKIGFFANLFLVILCIVTVIIYPCSFYNTSLQLFSDLIIQSSLNECVLMGLINFLGFGGLIPKWQIIF